MMNPQRFHAARRRHDRPGTLGLLACAALFGACSALPPEKKSEDSSITPPVPQLIEAGADATTTEPNCLLPGRVKRLASHFTYIEARRTATISAQDCTRRGGEILSRRF